MKFLVLFCLLFTSALQAQTVESKIIALHEARIQQLSAKKTAFRVFPQNSTETVYANKGPNFLSWSGKIHDDANEWTSVNGRSRFTPKSPGVYQVNASITVLGTTVSNNGLQIFQRPANIRLANLTANYVGSFPTQQVFFRGTTLAFLEEGDFLEFDLYNDGSNDTLRNVRPGNDGNHFIEIWRLP